MPLLKHAKKKQRQDEVRTIKNAKLENLVKSLIKKAKVDPTPEAVSAAFKQIDKAAKHNIFHTNKAARLKSTLSKATASDAATASPTKKSAAKATAKKVAAKKDKAQKSATKKANAK